MKKTFIIKIICFAAIFVLLFHCAGQVLALGWSSGEMMSERYSSFEEEESVDVLYLGGSNIYADVAPAVVWHESGITGFNLGSSNNTMMLAYYQLRYALEKHVPSLVVLDVTGLSVKKNPAGKDEGAFQKIYSTLPDFLLKMELLGDICSHWEDVDPVMYVFPLLRYHDRWENLTEEDFNKAEISSQYEPFRKGCFLRTKVEKQDVSDFNWTTKKKVIPDENLEYLEKIYELCNENGIELLLTFCPNMRVRAIEYTTAEQFAEDHGLNFLGFQSPEEFMEIGIDPEDNFYNANHLNYKGQKTFSEYLAGYLEEHYSFNSHEQENSLIESWDEAYEQYMDFYEQALDEYNEEEK